MPETHPSWFLDGHAAGAIEHTLASGEVSIAVRATGDTELPPIILLHGGAAHSRWWDAVGGLLADRLRVLTPDLSGHGRSGWRKSYSIGTWADEVEALLDSPLVRSAPVLVGHSMGGHVAAAVTLRRGVDLAGTMLLDSKFTPAGVEPPRPVDAAARARNRRFYPDRDSIVAKFRLLPHDAEIPSWISTRVAANSITNTPDGWSWRFDPRFFNHDFCRLDDLHSVPCPIAVVGTDRGLVTATDAAEIAGRLGGGPSFMIRDSGHHALLSQPLQVALLIEALASQWSAAL